uniref:G_PROTEIN_RECEP_F1_2 domain-containing protein n=1 Tax=Anisakis simplex TaxID=6269 RepID=A0A0M3JYV3_ANISI
LAVSLLLIDIFTNHISNTKFAVGTSILLFVNALLAFISARLPFLQCKFRSIIIQRIDKLSQILLMLFSLLALLMSIIMCIESAFIINFYCSINDSNNYYLQYCFNDKIIIHVLLLSMALIQFTVTLITMLMCYRSLHKAYAVYKASSPYSTLIEGNLELFRRHAM